MPFLPPNQQRQSTEGIIFDSYSINKKGGRFWGDTGYFTLAEMAKVIMIW